MAKLLSQPEIKIKFREALNDNDFSIFVQSSEAYIYEYDLGDKIREKGIDWEQELEKFIQFFLETTEQTRFPADVESNRKLQNLVQKSEEIKNSLEQNSTKTPYEKLSCQEVAVKVEEIAYEHLHVFVGRDNDLRNLDLFLVNHVSGLMLVTAGAGFGKSALLANWRQRQLGKNYCVAYHCFDYRYETTRSLENVYRHLLAQLSNHYQLNLDSVPNNEIELRDRLYSSIKDIVVDREHPCIILIDSLDEADSPFERPFPQRLPEGVFVIASCRVDSDEDPSYLQTWKEVTKSTLIQGKRVSNAIDR
jgi:AAA ATPase domain